MKYFMAMRKVVLGCLKMVHVDDLPIAIQGTAEEETHLLPVSSNPQSSLRRSSIRPQGSCRTGKRNEN